MKKKLLILIVLSLPVFSVLLQPGYFTMHDDLQAVRQLEMDKCFADGQIPCRWVLDLGYGFGYPLFNFYPPLPYLVGQVYRAAGLSYIDVIKAVGVTGFILTSLFMFLLAREFWGDRGGFIASAVYTYAPYHSVDFYVRGAMNEFWAMAFYPVIFLFIYLLIKTNRSIYIPLLSLSVAGLMLSHNLMLMIFAPPAIIWAVFWVIREKRSASLVKLALSGIYALGLASFFTLPVLLEQQFVHVETLTIGYFNYLAHFLNLEQIFLRINWGYGESILGPADTMSFALGYLQWMLPVGVAASLLFIKKLRKDWLLIFMLLLFTLGALFFSHSKSTPLWIYFRPLQFLQFPWRFLTVAVFSASLISGAVGRILNKNTCIFLIALIIILNAGYFHPREWFPGMTDAQKFSGKSWNWQITGSIFDYLPIYAPMPPADPAGGDLGITSGVGRSARIKKSTNYQRYQIEILSDKAIVEIQTFHFPGWRVFLDGKPVVIDPARDPLLGRMLVDVERGSHELVAQFTHTPVRFFADVISLLSWLCLPVILWLTRKQPGSFVPAS